MRDILKFTKPKTKKTTGWNTQSELLFLTTLGTNSTAHGLSVETLLTRYEAAMAKRAQWDSIDKIEVQTAVRLMRK